MQNNHNTTLCTKEIKNTTVNIKRNETILLQTAKAYITDTKEKKLHKVTNLHNGKYC